MARQYSSIVAAMAVSISSLVQHNSVESAMPLRRKLIRKIVTSAVVLRARYPADREVADTYSMLHPTVLLSLPSLPEKAFLIFESPTRSILLLVAIRKPVGGIFANIEDATKKKKKRKL